MRGAAGHRAWLSPAIALLFGLALTWGLLRFGAAELEVLYRLFLFLVIPATVTVLVPPWREAVDMRLLLVGLVGVVLMGSSALQSSLEARGSLHLAVGWMALWIALWLTRRGVGYGRFLVVLLVLLGALEAFYGLVQSVGGLDYIGGYFRNRGRIATGTLINRNHYAALLNMILPLALGLLFAAQARRRAQPASRSEALARTWIVLLGCSAMGVGVLLSQSRGGTLSLLVTLLFMALLLAMGRRRVSRQRLSGVAALVLLFLIGGMGAAFGLEALFERFGRIEENLSRVEIYRDTVRMIGESPLAGVGPGMYRWTFRTYQGIQPDRLYDHTHNDYLETAAEWGVPLAVLAWGVVFWRLLRSSLVMLGVRDPWRQGLGLGTAGALFSILIHSLVDFSLQIPAILMVFTAIVALSWSLDLAGPGSRETPGSLLRLAAPPTAGVAVRILLLLALLVVAVAVLQRGRAAQAARPENGVGGLERAIAIDPAAPEPRFLLGMAYRDLPGTGTLEDARDQLRAAVRLNPYAWRYWLELSATQELTGRLDDAEESMRVAVRLNPGDGYYRWRLANLLLRRGSIDAAIAEMIEAVRLEPHLAQPAISLSIKAGADAEAVSALLPADRPTLVRLLSSVLKQTTTDGLAREIWSRLLSDPEPLTIAEGRGYVDRLFHDGQYETARTAWLELARVNGLDDREFESGTNSVWNGQFEMKPTDTPLGWRLGRSDGFEARWVAGEGVTGSAALMVEFLGTQNLNFAGVSQQVLLEPETSYRVSLAIRAEDLSTDQGVILEVLSRDPGGLLAATEPILGTIDWQTQELTLTTPAGSGRASIRLRRKPSQQIDNKLRGKVWLDSVRIERVNP